MRTNDKRVRDKVKKYILDCVHDDKGKQFTDIKKACDYLWNDFNDMANYPNNIKRIPVMQNRFSDYLQGGIMYFEVYTSKMENFLNSLGINPENKKYPSDRVQNLYSYLIYSEMLKNKSK